MLTLFTALVAFFAPLGIGTLLMLIIGSLVKLF